MQESSAGILFYLLRHMQFAFRSRRYLIENKIENKIDNKIENKIEHKSSAGEGALPAAAVRGVQVGGALRK